jgi:monofunctional biosynthetic peptidoglycan transglycosylase
MLEWPKAQTKPKFLHQRVVFFIKKRPVFFCVLCLLLLVTGNIGLYLIWPPMWNLSDENPASTAFMKYREKQWRASESAVQVRWTWVEFSRISPNLKRAVVVAEDSTFWQHSGFDWEGIRIALDKNIARRSLSVGGSSITQQLAKNLYLSPEKSIIRKLQEAILAWRLERNLSKERILEIYLNVAEWGKGIYGAEAAARYYFGVSAANLSKSQAATLAVMLPDPLRRSPDSRTVQRLSNIILRRM